MAQPRLTRLYLTWTASNRNNLSSTRNKYVSDYNKCVNLPSNEVITSYNLPWIIIQLAQFGACLSLRCKFPLKSQERNVSYPCIKKISLTLSQPNPKIFLKLSLISDQFWCSNLKCFRSTVLTRVKFHLILTWSIFEIWVRPQLESRLIFGNFVNRSQNML